MGDNFNLLWSVLMAAVFAFGAFQTWNGKTDFVGKNVENIKPELRTAYCKEMSMPMFLLAGVEVIDVILQLTIDFGAWSLMLLGGGILVGITWIVVIQRKYNKM
ncbi:MAG: hypothetical protein HFI65_09565 [Lachnospiraceae bacterium]|nr:hypothetical protein [Lachnospiraceae bacterium]